MKQFGKLYTVFGGQFGSEGKGQIVRHIAGKLEPAHTLAYRIGGPNAGHTFYVGDDKIVTCQLPGPMFVSHDVTGIIGPEGVISLPVLRQELKNLVAQNDKHRGRYPTTSNLYIDRCAIIITDEDHDREVELVKNIGSTGKGVGTATANKVLRNGKAAPAEKHPGLQNLIDEFYGKVWIAVTDTILLGKILTQGSDLWTGIIEGTQGAGLSLHTGGYYPYCTSRECTPQGIWSGCGLHPAMAEESETVMVVRTYPIRVAGPSGPLENEVTWELLSEKLGRPVEEITTVSKKVRRVAEIDYKQLIRTIGYTCPDYLAVTFLDYIDPNVYKQDPRESQLARAFIQNLESTLGVPVKYVCTGEGYTYDWI